MLEKPEFLIAHNAEFAQSLVYQIFKSTRIKHWKCSKKDIDWAHLGIQASEFAWLLKHHQIEMNSLDSEQKGCICPPASSAAEIGRWETLFVSPSPIIALAWAWVNTDQAVMIAKIRPRETLVFPPLQWLVTLEVWTMLTGEESFCRCEPCS